MRSFIRLIRRAGGFTLIELLTVMTIIAILAALVLSISGYANKKAALARAQAEIQALSAGCESYKTDNGTYPHQPVAVSGSIPATANIPSDLLDPRASGISSSGGVYNSASIELYEALTGDVSLTGTGGGPGVHNYIADFRPDAFPKTSGTVSYLSDPFGNCYGYSTANSTSVSTGVNSITQAAIVSGSYPGFNPTFDLWSTGGQLTNPAPGSLTDPSLQWVKNW